MLVLVDDHNIINADYIIRIDDDSTSTGTRIIMVDSSFITISLSLDELMNLLASCVEDQPERHIRQPLTS